MANFRKQKRAERFISNEQRQRADRVNKAEVNYAGVPFGKKNVIKLHEDFTCRAFPPAEFVKADVLKFYETNDKLPTEITVPFSTTTSTYCVNCPELRLPWPIVSLRVLPGEFLELR